MASRCVTIIGTLVSHPCGQLASAICTQCSQPTCPRHLSGQKAGVCVTCSGEHVPAGTAMAVTFEEMLAFTDTELAAFEQRRETSLHTYDS
ncbi:MAG TPA: hypothetical protein VNM90_09375 [Haliangium sp.]|nr:hypothetical protein [Haliangium sp.]